MKKHIVLLLMLIVGCKENIKVVEPIKGEHIFIDSLHKPMTVWYDKRYFHFSYMLTSNISGKNLYGDDWFSCSGGFPSKHIIDSLIHTQLIYEKKCYSDIIILSIFEFQSKEDYDSFNEDNEPAKVYKHKLKCPL